MSGLQGQAAIVTGASRGIGEAAARELAAQGVSVLLAARTDGETGRIAEEIRAAGGAASAHACDVADYAQTAALVERAQAQFGRLDILVNNAGLIDPIARLGESHPEGWDRLIDVNVKGVYHGMRAAIPVMEAAGAGTIVNISSGAATSVLEGWSHYCASKAAVLSLTRSGDLEYGEKGIRVVGLSPGTVATYMQKTIKKSGLNPISELEWEDHIPPEWPARAIAWLCGPAAEAHRGGDVSLRDEGVRRAVGLIG